MNDDLAAGGEGHDHGSEAQIVTQRTHRVDDRGVRNLPVRCEHTGVGEQRIVAMHHALRQTGCTRGECEIKHAIRICWRRVDGGACGRDNAA